MAWFIRELELECATVSRCQNKSHFWGVGGGACLENLTLQFFKENVFNGQTFTKCDVMVKRLYLYGGDLHEVTTINRQQLK